MRLMWHTLMKNTQINIEAVSNTNGFKKFKIKSLKVDQSYLSKGGKVSIEGEKIKTTKLDSINLSKLKKPIMGIKIDTEGEDLNVLLGAENIIQDFRPKIIVEVREDNKTSIKNFFDKHNYGLYDANNTKKQIDINQHNIEIVSNIYASPN